MREEWSSGILAKNSAQKANARRRQITPEAFSATDEVRGKSVLLLDDTFTSGGTLASAAYALKCQGATRVVGLAFGRQLGYEWGDSRRIIDELPHRTLDLSQCAVHNVGSGPDWFFPPSSAHGFKPERASLDRLSDSQ
ncbi:phosphoribosyltransferase family protein [Streptomyces sp. SRF1]|uniref:ComF family protein n=1 Tax=Streptomyces sp. SRF1 TaxID=1549642 RepID=UPI00339D89F2